MLGRPTKYTPELIARVEDYIENHSRYGDLVPTIRALAVHLDLTRQTLMVWKREKEEFSYMLGRLLTKQARLLINGGLSGEFNSAICKLMLAKHGYNKTARLEHKQQVTIKKYFAGK